MTNNKWFDTECKNLRKTVRKLSNEKHRDLDDHNLRCQYEATLKQYKYTLKTKKEQHSKNQLCEIEESLESNQFWEKWNNLNKTQQDELAIQDGNTWINHFRELYSNITKNYDQYKIFTKWNPVTEQELTEVIQSLKGKKACGIDGILNEMIKYSDHKIRLAILKLFNTILATGTFPEIWNKELIIPIHKSVCSSTLISCRNSVRPGPVNTAKTKIMIFQ